MDGYIPVVDEEGNYIINENTILIGNITTEDCLYVPLTEEIRSQFKINVGMINEDSEKDELKDSKIWTRENTLFLIDTYKQFSKQFSSGMKKNAWEKVAATCQHLNINITAKQCETKWKTLKRTYINIKNHNNTSGQNKKYWEYYDLMNDILFNKPEIEPVATCSSVSGLCIGGEKKTEAPKNTNDKENPEENPQFESNFTKKRKQRISDSERRHTEKMQRLDKFNELFEKMVQKMPAGTEKKDT